MMTMKIPLLLLLIVTGIGTARAGEPEQFSYKWWKQDAYWGQYFCGGKYRPEGCDGYRRWRRWQEYRRPAPDADIMKTQMRLRELDFSLEADGFMGPETREAIREFQRRNGLEITGELGERTLQALHETERRNEGRRGHLQCQAEELHVWSGQHNNEAISKGDAQKRWMIGVQAKHGSIYMNFSTATSVTWRCFQSQSHDTFLGKVQSGTSKILGGEGYFVVCELWARACAAPIEGE